MHGSSFFVHNLTVDCALCNSWNCKSHAPCYLLFSKTVLETYFWSELHHRHHHRLTSGKSLWTMWCIRNFKIHFLSNIFSSSSRKMETIFDGIKSCVKDVAHCKNGYNAERRFGCCDFRHQNCWEKIDHWWSM